MKKSFYLCLLFCCSIVVIASCSKIENQVTTTKITEDLKCSESLLEFNSIESYENFITNYKQAQKEIVFEKLKHIEFTNYLSNKQNFNYLKNKQETISDIYEMDDELGQMLNEDGLIRIGDYLFKINLFNDEVRVISFKDGDDYQTARSVINNNSKDVLIFSTSDDVLYMLNDTQNNTGTRCGGIGGGVYPSYEHPYQGLCIYSSYSTPVVWYLIPYVKFFRAGIFFKLSSNFEIWQYPNISDTIHGQVVPSAINISNYVDYVEMFIRYPLGWWRKRPCDTNSVGTISYGHHYYETFSSRGSRAVYQGTRNLNGYYFYVQGRAKLKNGSITVASPYGGRNINSPY